ncbi:serine/threonine-protein kinase [Chondromyces apiculatus]|nr:serine/threonine-protein kinase [Chondromyces apiculatus]
MGSSVWVADHTGLRSQVAVKFLDGSQAKDPDLLMRFRQEARAAAQLKNPHVAQVLGHGVTDDNEAYLVLELLEGETLQSRLQRLGPRPLNEVARIVSQAAKALGQAHRFGVFHRDIRPETILLVDGEGEPFVKVIDFGFVRSAGADSTRVPPSGQPATPYMSPEQLDGVKQVDHHADLWSLAVVAYEALTGRPPFRADSLSGLVIAVETGAFARPSTLRRGLPEAVDAWVARALQRDPEARFGSARDLAEAFESATGAPTRASSSDVDSGPVPSVSSVSSSSRPTARPIPPTPDSRPGLGPPSSWSGSGLVGSAGLSSAMERGPESRRIPVAVAVTSAEETSRARLGTVPREAQELQVKEGRVSLVRGHIVKLGTEAIVCPADEKLTPGFDGVSQAIHRAAGPELAEMATRIGRCAQGNAEITGAGRLPSPIRNVIHAAGPLFQASREPECAALLKRVVEVSLQRAEQYNIRSVAFPAMSTSYGYPIEKAAPILLEAAVEHLQRATSVRLIVFALLTDVSFTVFSQSLGALSRKKS